MPYPPMHPIVTFTDKRRAVTGEKRRESVSTVGTFVGGYEDSPGRVLRSVGGDIIIIEGCIYADRAQDLPVFRDDVLEFTDPATSQARSLAVVDRRGPFDPTDDEDHFELDLASEQAARRHA